MQISRKDFGYAIYSRLEEGLRHWISERMLVLLGPSWPSVVPLGVWAKAQNKSSSLTPETTDDPLVVLDETDLPDLMEILCYKNSFYTYLPDRIMTAEEFRNRMNRLYDIRNKIAHVRLNFGAMDLDLLIDIANSFLPVIGSFGGALRETLYNVQNNVGTITVRIPDDFLIYDDKITFAHLTNLPPADYDPDGGFIGRREDLHRLEKLILGDVHRVITIAGAGGVGKTAVAHHLCQNLLRRETLPFSALIWVSAKEEKLTATGIEKTEPTFRTYVKVLDNILLTVGRNEDINKSIEGKEESVEVILRKGEKGILLVVDNLETIQDNRIIEFIKDFPPPNKVLITSRLGLGEVERRYPLKEMTRGDAAVLLRTIARDKGLADLASLPDDVISAYVDRMSRYPVAIKWVLGQVALGRDINIALAGLTSSTGDVARFCFDHIFESLLNDNARLVLYSLALYDKPLTRGILNHVANLEQNILDGSIQDLTVASLIIPSQIKSNDETIETRYELIPLTTNYIRSKLTARPEIYRTLESRIAQVQNLIEEAEKAGKAYRYSLQDMGADTEEEKVAAIWAMTGHQKYQSGDYEGAVQAFERSSEIAPNFSAVYRNWAVMESEAGFFDHADQLMRKATTIEPNDPRLWFAWGNIEKTRQRYDPAGQYLRRALELSPNDSPILGALGEVEKRRENFEEAGILLLKSVNVSKTRWNQIVCFTSLADNLRRWAEALSRDKNFEESLVKLKQAHEAATKAVELGEDVRARNVLREVCLELGRAMIRRDGFESGRKFLEQAITRKPRRFRDRKVTQVACYILASRLLNEGQPEQARQYYSAGLEVLMPSSKIAEAYKELGSEFSQDRVRGTLKHVIKSKGYGFIGVESRADDIYVYFKNVIPRVTLDEFDNLEGRSFSFLVVNSNKYANRIEAVRARIVDLATD